MIFNNYCTLANFNKAPTEKSILNQLIYFSNDLLQHELGVLLKTENCSKWLISWWNVSSWVIQLSRITLNIKRLSEEIERNLNWLFPSSPAREWFLPSTLPRLEICLGVKGYHLLPENQSHVRPDPLSGSILELITVAPSCCLSLRFLQRSWKFSALSWAKRESSVLNMMINNVARGFRYY